MKENMFDKPKPGQAASGKEKPEKEDKLASLWKRYRFFGQPPKEGSPVAQRLYDTCETYIKSVARHAKGKEKLSENAVEMIKFSDSYQRELHNQIALMALGKQRSGLDERRATELREFACQLVHGCSFEQLIKDLAEYDREA